MAAYTLETTLSKTLENFRKILPEGTADQERCTLLGLCIHYASFKAKEEQPKYAFSEIQGKAQETHKIAETLQGIMQKLAIVDPQIVIHEFLEKIPDVKKRENQSWDRLEFIFESVDLSLGLYESFGRDVENKFFPFDLGRGNARVRKHEQTYTHFLEAYNRTIARGNSFTNQVSRNTIVRSRLAKEEEMVRNAIIRCLKGKN
ncbi:hypothetical protein HYT51_01275 [Candidatus Woesearchaeota archaeon]|nr:hypothetical protein [Candidatus Woesearchaeota archaeon]